MNMFISRSCTTVVFAWMNEERKKETKNAPDDKCFRSDRNHRQVKMAFLSGRNEMKIRNVSAQKSNLRLFSTCKIYTHLR